MRSRESIRVSPWITNAVQSELRHDFRRYDKDLSDTDQTLQETLLKLDVVDRPHVDLFQ